MVGDREDHSSAALDTSAILALCDRVVGEAGRRRHLFSWLRAPGSDTGQWLAVDAYYPGNRLVVVCGEHSAEDENLYAQLVPAHGLRLLYADEAELGPDAASAEANLRQMIADLALPRRPTGASAESDGHRRETGPGTFARIAAAFAQAGSAPGGGTRGARARPRPRPTGRPGRPGARVADQPAYAEAAGVAAGLALAFVVCAEVYLGVGRFALAGGHWLLAFGIAMDAISRVLGAVAAERSGRARWTWWCVLVGSPAVVRFVLYDEEGPITIEPAPLAAVVAVLALGALGVAVVAAMLGF